MKNKIIKYSPIIILLMLFSYIYVSNLIYEFNDIDDADTILYHMLGRNADIQKSYNPYDSMSDKILSFLPLDYNILFSSMILLTLFFTIVMLIEIAFIIKYKLNIKNEFFVYSIPLLLVFISPEIIYLSITFKTSIIGFSFALLSQIIIINKKTFFQKNNYVTILLSALTFAFGISLRWNIITYGAVIIYEIVSKHYKKNKKVMLKEVIIWGVSSIIFIIIFIYLSGYSIIEFVEIAIGGRAYLDKSAENIQMATIILDATPFFTPAFMLLLFIGLILIIKNKRFDILTFFAVSFFPYIFLRIYPWPKYILPLFPALFIIIMYPFIFINNLFARRIMIISVIILILFNWFVGIKIDAENTVFGPGFSYKQNNLGYSSNEKSADKRVNIKKINLDFSDGFLFPTQEGERPLYGHFYVLLMGKYINFLNERNIEYQTIVNLAGKGIPILNDRGNSLLLNKLVYNGYVTNDPWNKKGWNGKEPIRRSFFKKDSTNNKIDTYRFSDVKILNNIDTIRSEFKGKLLIITFTYSYLVNKFLNDHKHFIYPILRIGPYSSLILVE